MNPLLGSSLLVAASLLVRPARAQSPVEAPFVPNVRPTLEVRRAPGPISIDGDLADAGWVRAARAENFTETDPRDNVRPSVESVVWVTYDASNLYLAFIAKDDPTSVRSSLTDRDQIFQDDFFGIVLDTFGDGSWAYELFANPRGIQGDLRMAANQGEDERFDLIYRSFGKMTADGWVVEMAIPFASLRFPDRDRQTWRATFIRKRPRTNRENHSWTQISRDNPCFMCQFGTITGIEGVRAGGALELIPSAIAGQSSALRDESAPALGMRNGKVDGDLSLTAKYSFKSGLTAEGTLNPDFSQVESDAGQVNVNNTFALSFPERRPFFQEGGELFSTNISAVYTRNINDPLAAIKLIQRQGRTALAYLGARDDHSPLLLPFEERSFSASGGKSVSNILRLRRSFGQRSNVGAILTDRRLDEGGSGTLAGVDGLIAFGQNHQLEFQLVGSRTREPNDPSLTAPLGTATFARGKHTAAFDGESFTGYAQYTSFERNARTWNFDFDYYAYSPTFRADNGFVTRNDQRRTSMWQGLNFYSDEGFFQRIDTGLYLFRNWDFNERRKAQGAELSVGFEFKGQTEVEFEFTTDDELFRNVHFEGMDRMAASFETAFSKVFRFGVGAEYGERIARNIATPAIGKALDVEAWAVLRPASWVTIEPSIEHSDLNVNGVEAFSGAILRTRAQVQFNRQLFLRLIVEHDGFGDELSVEPLLTYRANPFTMVYLGSTRGYRKFDGPTGWARTDTQYFAKVQYLIRR
ncbi:MAG: carbohydrate binding family 9 domain-containing protein [Gemmatimonadales bacterium]|nr:carbohydrate binding family 9 domain-containing protein [Gemmatimonadales bacterium]